MEEQSSPNYTIGMDFGSNSVRAVVVNTQNGSEVGVAVYDYPSGEKGILLDPSDHNLARQSPSDYLGGTLETLKQTLQLAQANDPDFSPERVAGIGVTATGSSPLPVDKENRPLAFREQFAKNPNAQCWLWKDHTSTMEAHRITEFAKKDRPQFLERCGGSYSSEWFWSKVWHCANVDPDLFSAIHSWVELADWIPSVLAGVRSPEAIRRGICAAGHKALYSADWGGLADKEFLERLDPRLADLRDRLFERTYDASQCAGRLCQDWADSCGLPTGIPIAIGALDVHYGAIGAGISECSLVKVIGTSSCDCAIANLESETPVISGICGIVESSILPRMYGIEAGQSAVGDIFAWFVERVCKGNADTHAKLTEEASSLKPGQSGLIALDWNNGNRNVLADPLLTGLLVGQTLHTTQAEIYRALIEATAFGARMILEQLESGGVTIDRIICAGGIAERNQLLMQIYADITGRELRISSSSQTCALGAAVVAAVCAGTRKGGYDDFETAQQAMTSLSEEAYQPNRENQAAYQPLFEIFKTLHDAFGRNNEPQSLGTVMKTLLELKQRARVHSTSK
ncbi:ribulokinase [Pelagicoccus enzymogenes]|uniref:ribulokinase n=1 Tax=Pelagicoccus enzymogenes TaxID=2773457 RepID=UPI00280D7EDC|nr:ribulokinase [Pelagicoccus enzymogenes]MDQ8199396.1 ribulokinase [Pelagicoccus enzymogenes]